MKKRSNAKKVSAFGKLGAGLEDAIAYQRGERMLTAREVGFRPLPTRRSSCSTSHAVILRYCWNRESTALPPMAGGNISLNSRARLELVAEGASVAGVIKSKPMSVTQGRR